MSINSKGRPDDASPGNRCFAGNVIDIHRVRSPSRSPNCQICGDKRLLIVERIIEESYTDDTLDEVIAILIAAQGAKTRNGCL